MRLTPDQSAKIEEKIDQFLAKKEPTEMDTDEVREVKTLIRRMAAGMSETRDLGGATGFTVHLRNDSVPVTPWLAERAQSELYPCRLHRNSIPYKENV